jgi:hypothetical protein
MVRGFRLFGRGSTSGADSPHGAPPDAVPGGVEIDQAAQNEARRRASENEADSQASANEARRQASENAAREQAIVNEARRQASDSQARSQMEANEARHRGETR